MKYLIGWLKSCGLEFELAYDNFKIMILWLNFYVTIEEYIRFSISLALPKYALILTNSDKYFYQNEAVLVL